MKYFSVYEKLIGMTNGRSQKETLVTPLNRALYYKLKKNCARDIHSEFHVQYTWIFCKVPHKWKRLRNSSWRKKNRPKISKETEGLVMLSCHKLIWCREPGRAEPAVCLGTNICFSCLLQLCLQYKFGKLVHHWMNTQIT